MLICVLAIELVVGLPALLVAMLVSEQDGAALLIALAAVTLLGAAAAYAIGGAFGKRPELQGAFIAGPLVLAAQILLIVITTWDTTDLFGRTVLLPYVVGTVAFAVGFFARRQQLKRSTQDAVSGSGRPA